MTKRKFTRIKIPTLPNGVECETPIVEMKQFRDVKATHSGERTITIFGRIGEGFFEEGITSNSVSDNLKEMGAGPVTANINSRGGDFFEGLAIYNMLREHDGEITVNVFSLAASAASVIAMAADTLNVAKAGFLMIHNSHGHVMGGRDEFVSAASLFGQFDETMASLYADRSGLKETEITKMMEAETFMSGETAVKNGMADSLLPSDMMEEESNTKAQSLRQLEVILAASGQTRSERRSFMSNLFEKPQAVKHPVMPGADLNLTPLSGILKKVKSL